MRHDVNDLFRQRFQGHEAPVDPGMWQAIQGKLTASAPVAEQDQVNELFRERFQGHEVQVDPAVWQSISTQLGHTATVGAAGGGFLGWAAAGVAALAIGTGAFFLLKNDVPSAVEPVQLTEAVVPPIDVAAVDSPAVKVLATNPVVVEPARPAPPRTTRPARTPATRRTTVPAATHAAPQRASGAVAAPVLAGEAGPSPDLPPAEPQDAERIEQLITEMALETEKAVKTEDSLRNAGVLPLPGQPSVAMTDPAEEPAAPPPALPKLFLPNTFTPNGDGVNDQYEIGGLEEYEQVIVRVSSLKTGQVVFSTNSNEAWQGSNCEDGYYVVAVEARTAEGRSATEGKVVWLNRNRMN